MKTPQRSRSAVLLAGLLSCAGLAAMTGPAAQAAGRIMLAQDQSQGDVPDDNGDQSSMVVRMGRMENQIRNLTGQIEQLQFQNKRLEDDLRKMQGDVDFRFQDLQRGAGAAGAAVRPVPQHRSDADGDTPDAAAMGAGSTGSASAAPAVASVSSAPSRSARTTAGDAFDPNANPNAPGSPRPLGTTQPSAPILPRTATAASRGAPLDLMRRPSGQDDDTGVIMPPSNTPSIIAAPPAARALPDSTAVASLTPGGTRGEFDADIGLFKQGQYDGAATSLQGFVDKYPRDRLVPDAVYMIGESYSRLGRHREAAEQFLKLSTDYSKSSRAPDALLRLGMSLNALGAKEQACATYQEVTRKYPAASPDVRAGVDRELKRSRCPPNG